MLTIKTVIYNTDTSYFIIFVEYFLHKFANFMDNLFLKNTSIFITNLSLLRTSRKSSRNEGSGESVQMRRLARAFVSRIFKVWM